MQANKKVWDWRALILHYAPNNPTYKHLLLTLSCYMNSAGGSCFPSVDTLCEVTSLTKPTVIKYLKQANKDGWLITEDHGFSGQGWRRNQYTANIPDRVVNEINHEGGKTDNKGGKTVSEGGKTDNKKAVKEVNPISSRISTDNSTRERENTHFQGVPIPETLQAVDGFLEWFRKFADFRKDKHKNHLTAIQTELEFNQLTKWHHQGKDVCRILENNILRNAKNLHLIEDEKQSKQEPTRSRRPGSIQIN